MVVDDIYFYNSFDSKLLWNCHEPCIARNDFMIFYKGKIMVITDLFSFLAVARLRKVRRHMIYEHSKLMVIDETHFYNSFVSKILWNCHKPSIAHNDFTIFLESQNTCFIEFLFSFLAAAKLRKVRRHMIYVHSKLMVVDDAYVITGSANINQRSTTVIQNQKIPFGNYQF